MRDQMTFDREAERTAPTSGKRNSVLNAAEVGTRKQPDLLAKIFAFEIADLIILNSYSGTAFVCIKKDQNWGLLEIKANDTIECEWKMISEFTYPTSEKMLSDFKINRGDFIL